MRSNLTILLRNNFSLIVLLLVSFFIYIPSLSGDFVVDDIPLISDNPYMHGNHIADFFSKGLGSNTELGDNNVPLYRPLVLVIFSLSHGLWGNNPAGYHVFLLLLHLANIVLVYFFIRKLTAASPIAATFGTAIFALHPTRVESVAWLSGITDPLAVFFLLGAMLAHRSFTENPKGWGYLALSLFCFQMALWSKEVAIVFPLIVIAHDLIYRKKINWLAVSMHTLLGAAYLATRSIALGTTGKWDAINSSQLPKAFDFVLGYSEMLVFPAQIPFYMQLPENPVSSALGWVSAVVITAMAGFSWLTFNPSRRRAFIFSAVWLIALSWPIILITLYMKGYAARFLYVPAVGVAIFAAILYSHLIESYPSLKMPIIATFMLVISFYGAITWKDIPAWHDDGTIYRKVTEVAPESAAGYSSLGNFYMRREDYATAEKNYLISLQKAKTSHDRAISLLALGTIYGMANKIEQSERYLSEAVQIEPRNSEALAGLGNLALMQRQFSEAISYYEKAIAARPRNYEAATNLALIYDKIGQPERAELVRRSIR